MSATKTAEKKPRMTAPKVNAALQNEIIKRDNQNRELTEAIAIQEDRINQLVEELDKVKKQTRKLFAQNGEKQARTPGRIRCFPCTQNADNDENVYHSSSQEVRNCYRKMHNEHKQNAA